MSSGDTMIAISVICRALVGVACVAGAVRLIMNNKSGWGWLIFLALMTNSFSLITGE